MMRGQGACMRNDGQDAALKRYVQAFQGRLRKRKR
jgi:hypothetical protein